MTGARQRVGESASQFAWRQRTAEWPDDYQPTTEEAVGSTLAALSRQLTHISSMLANVSAMVANVSSALDALNDSIAADDGASP